MMLSQVAYSSTGEPLRAKIAGNARQFLSFKFIDWRDVCVGQSDDDAFAFSNERY